MTESLYETNFYQWTRQQVQFIRSEKFSEIDKDNIIEEIEDMGKSLIRALESRLEVLLMHLLKWQYQPFHRSKSWRITIVEQRLALAKLIRKNPSLKSKIPNIILESYTDAIIRASVETELPKSTFPKDCPYRFEETMNEDFWPN